MPCLSIIPPSCVFSNNRNYNYNYKKPINPDGTLSIYSRRNSPCECGAGGLYGQDPQVNHVQADYRSRADFLRWSRGCRYPYL